MTPIRLFVLLIALFTVAACDGRDVPIGVADTEEARRDYERHKAYRNSYMYQGR